MLRPAGVGGWGFFADLHSSTELVTKLGELLVDLCTRIRVYGAGFKVEIIAGAFKVDVRV